MTPVVLLLVTIATLCAAAAHLALGRRWRQLPVFWLAAFVGCLLGYSLGLRQTFINLPEPAGVPLIETVLPAFALLFIAARLRV